MADCFNKSKVLRQLPYNHLLHFIPTLMLHFQVESRNQVHYKKLRQQIFYNLLIKFSSINFSPIYISAKHFVKGLMFCL